MDDGSTIGAGHGLARRKGLFLLMTLAPLLASGPSRHMPAMLGLSADFWHGVVTGLALVTGVVGIVLTLRDHHAGRTA